MVYFNDYTEAQLDNLVDKIIMRLNDLLVNDPAMVENMLNMKVNCNSNVSEDDTIFTRKMTENLTMIDLLGFLNSLFPPIRSNNLRMDGKPRISVRYEMGPVQFFNTKKLS